jgi:hypothetical protein
MDYRDNPNPKTMGVNIERRSGVNIRRRLTSQPLFAASYASSHILEVNPAVVIDCSHRLVSSSPSTRFRDRRSSETSVHTELSSSVSGFSDLAGSWIDKTFAKKSAHATSAWYLEHREKPLFPINAILGDGLDYDTQLQIVRGASWPG